MSDSLSELTSTVNTAISEHLSMMSPVRIGTHDGVFHCDEVLSCVMLKLLPKYRDADIVRTRDQASLDECAAVVDVGGQFDPARRRYDHHMQDFSMTMKELSEGKIRSNIMVSSAGLVFWFHGREVISEVLQLGQGVCSDQLEYVFHQLYWQLIQEIDANDNHQIENNIVRTGIASRVAHLRPSWDDQNQDFEAAFDKAYAMVKEEFLFTLKRLSCEWRAGQMLKEKVKSRLEDHPSGTVLFLDKWINWTPFYKVLKEIKFVMVYDEEKRIYSCTCNMKLGYGVKGIKFPKAWWGLSGQQLEDVSGVEGSNCVQVIKDGRKCWGESKEVIIKMIEETLRQQRANRESNNEKE